MDMFVIPPPNVNNMTTDKHWRHYKTEILLNWFYRLITYVKLLIFIICNVKKMHAPLKYPNYLNYHGI